jgi:glycosyltransferase involved in cell wall biosynthesis
VTLPDLPDADEPDVAAGAVAAAAAGATPHDDLPPDTPHVVMLVGNPVHQDARVRKTALSAAAFGLKVSVVAYDPALRVDDGTRVEWMGAVQIVNVPVEFTLRDRANEVRRMRRRVLFPFGYGTRQAAQAASRRRRLADLELMADMGAGVRRGDYAGSSVVGGLARARRQSAKAINRGRRKIVYARTIAGRFYTGRRLPLDDARARAWFSRRPMGNWRRLLPEYLDLDFAFAPVVDGLAPDLIHANDVNMMGIAAGAVDRARLARRIVPWVYDAHEFVPGMSRYYPDRIAGMADHEMEFIGRADAVMTVSEPIADAIQQRTGLAQRPTVVLNTASSKRLETSERPSVRRAAGLAEGVPLLVYSGNIDPDRGVTTLVEALEHLDASVHVVIVTNAPMDNRYVQTLISVAAERAAGSRLHFVPYVPGEQIIDFLFSATVGVHGLTHVLNHEMALPNKLFDYMHARLPMIVSDVKAMAEFVAGLGIGEVYVSGDAASLASAAERVIADRGRYVAALEADPEILRRYSWEYQEAAIREVYAALLGRELAVAAAGGAG